MHQSTSRRERDPGFLGSSFKRRFVFSSRRLSRILQRSHSAPRASAGICRRHDSLEHDRAEAKPVAVAEAGQFEFALDSSACGGPLVKLCDEQLMLGSGIVCVGLDSDADEDVTELAGEAATSMSLKPFGCIMTIRRPSSPGASWSATPHPRLARCDFVWACVGTWACALASNQFASMDPFAYGAQGAYAYGRSAYGANCPGGGGAGAYWYAWKGLGAGELYVYDGRSGYTIGE